MNKWLNYKNPAMYKSGNKISDKIAQVIESLIQSPEETLAVLQEAGKEGETVLTQISELAQSASEGNQDPIAQKALEAMSAVNNLLQNNEKEAYLSSLKCGGRIKKATNGKKISKVNRKAKCGCVLKKVGGRIIEVDGCMELPIAKKGTKIVKGALGIAEGLQDKWTAPLTDWKEGDPIQSQYFDTSLGKWQYGTWDTANKKWNYTDLTPEQYESLAQNLVENKNDYFKPGFSLVDPIDMTGKFDTQQNAQTALGKNSGFQLNTGYGTKRTVDTRGALGEANTVTNTELIGSRRQAERTARKQLRQDRRDLRAYAREYKNYLDNNYEGGIDAFKKDYGIDGLYSTRKLMSGTSKGSKAANWLSERAQSAQSYIDQGVANAAPKELSDITNKGNTQSTQPDSSDRPKIKRTIGSGSFKLGGWLHKFDK